MKVLLAYVSQYADRNDYYLSLMPAGLPSIASSLEAAGHHVVLANLSSMGWEKGARYIREENPGVLGVSIFSYNRSDSFSLIREVKKRLPGMKIVIGGHHPSFLSDEISKRYPEVDHIITGEGEASFVRLLADIEAGKSAEGVITGERVHGLDILPMGPKFSGTLRDVNVNEQYKFIITSRGCPGRCTYCSSPSFWKRRVEFRSAGNIIEEIRHIYHTCGIIYFSIRDDNFTLKKKRVIEFSRMLQESGMYLLWNCQARVDTVDQEMLIEMKRAGLEHIQYGVESGSERILDKYDKSITLDDITRASELTRKAGVYLSMYLMSGMEGEDRGDVDKTMALMKKTLPHDCILSPVAYYPGTGLYKDMKKSGKISDDIWFESAEPGIFLRNDKASRKWLGEIMGGAEKVSSMAEYTAVDFRAHRKITGDDCWVTDLMEGEMYETRGDYKRGADLYGRVIDAFPENIWGYYRMGRLAVSAGNHESAVRNYTRASEINPRFYGPWLKLAEIFYERRDRVKAWDYIRKAYDRNNYDVRIAVLMKALKRDKKN